MPLLPILTDIVEIKHIMLPPNPRDYKDIYVVFELMETDLHQVRASGVESELCCPPKEWWEQLTHGGHHVR